MTWWIAPVIGGVAGALPGILREDGDGAVIGALAGLSAGYFVDQVLAPESDRELWERRAPERRCYQLTERVADVRQDLDALRNLARRRDFGNVSYHFWSIRHTANLFAKEFPPFQKESKELARGAKAMRGLYEKPSMAWVKMSKAQAEHIEVAASQMYDYWVALRDRVAKSCGAWGAPGVKRPLEKFPTIPKERKAEVQKQTKEIERLRAERSA